MLRGKKQFIRAQTKLVSQGAILCDSVLLLMLPNKWYLNCSKKSKYDISNMSKSCSHGEIWTFENSRV